MENRTFVAIAPVAAVLALTAAVLVFAGMMRPRRESAAPGEGEIRPQPHPPPAQSERKPAPRPEPEPQDSRIREGQQDIGAPFFVERRIESFAQEQDRPCEELEATADPATKARNAHVLTELWQRGLLANEIKDRLVDDYYRVVLLQLRGPYPGFHCVVRSHQTFPFPSVWTKFTPTLRANGKTIWSPTGAQRAHALSLNNSMITSLSGSNLRGGKIKKGDVLQYSIRMQQEVDKEIVWEKTILTNKIVVQDFSD